MIIVLSSAPLTRHLSLSLLVFVSAVLSACDRDARPEQPKLPVSPVGHFEDTSYKVAGLEKAADGTSQRKLVPQQLVTIDLRADHTFRYVWKSLVPTGAKDGSLEGTWRASPGPAEWLFRVAGDAGVERSVSFGTPVPFGEPPPSALIPGQWLFPMPDPATSKLTDNYVFIRIQ